MTVETAPVAAPLCSLAQRYTYHVVSSAASMPNKCRGVYKRVAVIEVDHHERPLGTGPTRIADEIGVGVVATWERLNVGTTDACAYRVALREAAEVADDCRAKRAREAAEDAGEVVSITVAA